jgi:hypothetical protein
MHSYHSWLVEVSDIWTIWIPSFPLVGLLSCFVPHFVCCYCHCDSFSMKFHNQRSIIHVCVCVCFFLVLSSCAYDVGMHTHAHVINIMHIKIYIKIIFYIYIGHWNVELAIVTYYYGLVRYNNLGLINSCYVCTVWERIFSFLGGGGGGGGREEWTMLEQNCHTYVCDNGHTC